MKEKVNLETLGKKLKRARVKKQLTLQKLGTLTGYSASIISRWERGQKEPRYTAIKTLERALQIEL